MALIKRSGLRLIIGRSPTCDIVLRVKGVLPVHFIVEWVGAGAFGESDDDGVWTVFDISKSLQIREKDGGKAGAGEGLIIGDKPVKIGEFEFSFRTDRLHHTTLKGGTLTDSFQEKKLIKSASSGTYQLEVVSIREDSGSVTHVRHMDPIKSGARKVMIPHVPLISVEWSAEASGVPVQIDTSRLVDARVYQGVSALLAGKHEEVKAARLVPGELVQINWQKSDHYFRLVPKIEVPPAPLSLFKDPFYRWAALTIVIMGSVFYALRNGDFVPPEPIKEPPRVAKIEIVNLKEMPPAPVEPPPEPVVKKEEPPKEEPPPKVKPPQEKPKKAENDEKPGPKNDEKAAPKAKLLDKSKDKKTGGIANSPAPKANVNTMGLLGALKTSKPNVVEANKVINDGIVSNTASGSEGKFVVQQPPSGVVGKKAKDNGGGLTAAFSKPTAGDSQSGSSVAAMAGAGGSGTSYKAFGGGGGGGDPYGVGDDFSAEGGLDKDAVRKALMAYRRDIRTCYDRALMLKPKIGGRITYKWRIHPDGHVEWINTTTNSTESPHLEACVQTVIHGIKFPKAGNGKPTIVIYPFQFQRKS